MLHRRHYSNWIITSYWQQQHIFVTSSTNRIRQSTSFKFAEDLEMNPGHVQSCSNLAKRWTCYNRCMIKFPWQQLINLTLQWLAKYNKCLTNIPRNDSEANLLGNLWRLWRANETSGRAKRSTEKRPNLESTIKKFYLKTTLKFPQNY